MENTFKAMREVGAEPLEWTQRTALRREYELRSAGALVIPELSLLALVGWYLMVLMSEDSGSA